MGLNKLFYDQWFKKINSYSKLVIFDAIIEDQTIIEDIIDKDKNGKIKKYIFIWNIITRNLNYNVFKDYKEHFELYDYDENDCRNYGIKFNTIMYDKTLILPTTLIEYDVFFLGFLKDKITKIKNIYEMLEKNNVLPYFYIISKEKVKEDLPFYITSQYVHYDQYLEMLSKSRCILDITQEYQTGFSMRVMESIFFDKKLISDNQALLSADFYNNNNIFVLDTNNSITLNEFMTLPMIPYPDSIKDYYSFEEWLKRFK